MFITGVLGWLYQIDSIKGSVNSALTNNHYLVPLAIAIPAAVGMLLEKLAIEPARDAEVVTLIIITIGVKVGARRIVLAL